MRHRAYRAHELALLHDVHHLCTAAMRPGRTARQQCCVPADATAATRSAHATFGCVATSSHLHCAQSTAVGPALYAVAGPAKPHLSFPQPYAYRTVTIAHLHG